MKNRTFRLAIAFVALAVVCGFARGAWKVHLGDEYSEEVRVWATSQQSGMDFSWSGKVNARHEAEGYGVLEWSEPVEPQPKPVLVYIGEMRSGGRHGPGVSLHRNGSKYSGQWSENLKEGKGE